MPGARCLRVLVLMMREYQIRATTVNVNWSTQVAMNHCAALTVPTWTTFSPRAWPARLTRLCSLPECKVKWIAFLVINLNALTCAKLIKIATRKHTIAVVRTNREVHVARRHRVSVTLLNQRLNHLEHGFNLVRCARTNIWIQNIEPMHLLNERLRKLFRNLLSSPSLLNGALNNLVVNIGQVLSKGDLKTLMHQITANNVKREEGTGVSDVNLIVNRRTAHVHADFALVDWLELFFFMRLSVIDKHAYSSQPLCIGVSINGLWKTFKFHTLLIKIQFCYHLRISTGLFFLFY